MLSSTERADLAQCLDPLRKAVAIQAVPQGQMGGLAMFLRRLETLRKYAAVEIEDAWKMQGAGREFSLVLLRLVSEVEEIQGGGGHAYRQKTTYNELYFAGLLLGTRDFGSALVRPEGLVDTLSEWIAPTELDFPDHPAFCRRWYVLAKDAGKFREAANRELLDLLVTFEGPHLEFNGKHLFYRWPRVISPDVARDTVELGMSLASCRL